MQAIIEAIPVNMSAGDDYISGDDFRLLYDPDMIALAEEHVASLGPTKRLNLMSKVERLWISMPKIRNDCIDDHVCWKTILTDRDLHRHYDASRNGNFIAGLLYVPATCAIIFIVVSSLKFI